MIQYRRVIWVVLLIALLVAFKLLFFKKEAGTSGNAMRKPSVPAVNGMVVKPQWLSNRALVSGSLEANESVDLQPEVSGIITGLFFKEGDRVKQGAVLVKINDASLRALWQKQEAALEVAENNMERIEKLYKLSSVSEDDYNNANLAVKTAAADMEYTKAEIEKTEIRAPFDGIIGVRHVSPGAFISPSTVIATLYSSNQIKVAFDLPEKFASQVKPGTSLTFSVQGSVKNYKAKVYVVNPGVNAETRTVTIRALCENDGTLRPGSFANIEIDLGSDPQALLVPTQALVPILNGQQVFVVRRDTAFPVPVQIGIRNDTAVQVTSGIRAGDTVITSGILFLRPKMKVQLKSVN
jgi:membrane fusion protein (multidrug efflux system)